VSEARRRRSWSATNRGNMAIREEVVEAMRPWLPRDRSDPLLDVGCGTGWWLRQLLADGRDPTSLMGVDIAPQRLELARRHLPAVRLQVADARELPFEHDSFAAVSMLLVLSSLGTRDAALGAVEEALRVLRPNGVLLIWDVRMANPRNRRTITPPWRELTDRLGYAEARALTLNPWSARRLGPRAGRWYAPLARIPALCSHRLLTARAT
jgi:ubiquinone/menaquinone biosynthesis C-methylase UbiE